MAKSFRHYNLRKGLLHIVVILLLALLLTAGSYLIVTRRNAPMDPRAVSEGQRSLTGESLITLPCEPAYGYYDSSNPKLPEARGIPFNYNYYNPCDGHKLLQDGFWKDIGFWIVVLGIADSYYIIRKQRVAQFVH